MGYSIKQVSEILNIPPSTIRFYDKEGLIPFVKRSKSGFREFNDNNIEMLKIVNCLKKTGMPIRQIKRYSDLAIEGSSTYEERYKIILEQKRMVEQQMHELQVNLDLIKRKSEYYEKSIKENSSF